MLFRSTAHFSPDGKRVVTASNEGMARLWDAATSEPIGEPMIHKARAYTAEFNSDGTRVVTASTDTTARVWDGITGAPITPPLQHQREVKSAKFSPDGSTVLTASEDTSAQLLGRRDGAGAGRSVTAPWRDLAGNVQ